MTADSTLSDGLARKYLVQEEAANFEQMVELGGGDPLKAIAVTLRLWAAVMPRTGSASGRCEVMADRLDHEIAQRAAAQSTGNTEREG